MIRIIALAQSSISSLHSQCKKFEKIAFSIQKIKKISIPSAKNKIKCIANAKNIENLHCQCKKRKLHCRCKKFKKFAFPVEKY